MQTFTEDQVLELAKQTFVGGGLSAEEVVSKLAKAMEDSKPTFPTSPDLHVGMQVKWASRKRGRGEMRGVIIRVNQKTCSIQTEECSWKVPKGMLQASDDNTVIPITPDVSTDKFSVGDIVTFTSGRGGSVVHVGRITKVNQKTLKVAEDARGLWSIHPENLEMASTSQISAYEA